MFGTSPEVVILEWNECTFFETVSSCRECIVLGTDCLLDNLEVEHYFQVIFLCIYNIYFFQACS